MTFNALNSLTSHLKPSPTMPVLFVGHGNPMNAIEDNSFTLQWQSVLHTIPDPQAIVVISAHWQTYGTHITSAPKQKIIYDMYGFPKELYDFTYDAKGDPLLANDMMKLLVNYEHKLDSSWGLDHGTWSILAHIAPKPHVPVLQISLDMGLSLEEQYELFATLRPFRNMGVLFIGSGNIVHNLSMARFDKPNSGYDWCVEFDSFVASGIESRDKQRLVLPDKFSPAYHLAVPTDEHYRPLLATIALAGESGEHTYFAEGVVAGSISMRSVLIT